ncbi:MAG TPA: DUF3679 domain-containing protein [Chondromyces sp.]|nr:DUF3679 domain-containing protein [Chondromyces sp.]
MKKFVLKCFLLVSLLFMGVLFGMQKANEGMKEMKGYHQEALEHPVQVEQTDEELEASFLGQQVSSQDLEEKKEKLQEIKAFNLFSSLGRNMAEGLSKLVGSIAEWLASLI